MTRDKYEIAARLYDTIIEPFMIGQRRIGMAMSPLTENTRVLDVCCGTGTFLQLFVQQGCECFGIDLSQAMLAKERTRLNQSAFLHEGDAAQMPFLSDMFDLAVTSMALHELHSSTRSAIIQEVRRVLSPKGHFLIIDYHPGPITSPKSGFNKIFIHFIEFAAGRTHFTNYRKFLKAGGIESLAKSNGLHMVEQKIVLSGNLGVYLFTI